MTAMQPALVLRQEEGKKKKWKASELNTEGKIFSAKYTLQACVKFKHEDDSNIWNDNNIVNKLNKLKNRTTN